MGIVGGVASENAAVAQIGASREQLDKAFPTLTAPSETMNEFLRGLGFAPRAVSLTNSPHEVGLGLRDDRVTLIHITNNGNVGKPDELKPDDLEAILATFGSQIDARGRKKNVKWHLQSRAGALFPTLGNSGRWMSEYLRPSKWFSRIVVVDGLGGQTPVTPWSMIGIPTGRLMWNENTSMTNKCVLQSDDAELYTILSVWTYRYQMGSVFYENHTLKFVTVCDASSFWNLVIRQIAEPYFGAPGDGYESQFNSMVPQDLIDDARAARGALAVLTAVETSAQTRDELMELYRAAVKFRPAVADSVKKLLYLPRPRIGKAFERLNDFASEIGTPEHIPELIKEIRASGSRRQTAVAALRTIAERYKLPPPPDDTGSTTAFQQWVMTVEPIAPR